MGHRMGAVAGVGIDIVLHRLAEASRSEEDADGVSCDFVLDK
jgi:hypothetical protein